MTSLSMRRKTQPSSTIHINIAVSPLVTIQVKEGSTICMVNTMLVFLNLQV